MPRVIIIPDNHVEKICQDAITFANNCQSDFQFYLMPQTSTDNSPLNKESAEMVDILKYLENVKLLYKYETDDLVLTFYNGILKATNYGVSRLFLAGSRYDEDQPCTGVISLKYLGWNILEEKYNYDVQKHSILHLIICGIIGAYTHLDAHNDIGCLLDKNMHLTSFNLKLQRGYYLCSKQEFACNEKIRMEKYGNAILRLCDTFKSNFSFNQGKLEMIPNVIKPENRKKNKLEFVHWFTIISSICAVLVLLFGNNIWGRLKGKETTVAKSDTVNIQTEVKHDTILFEKELPYLENVPIIDKGLFIKYYFNDFIFGGANLDIISINARTKSGEKLTLIKRKTEILMDINEDPFVEFEYKGTFYSIEITGYHPTFKCLLKKNIKPTLTLKKCNDL